jgi:prephenate dehydrogenase
MNIGIIGTGLIGGSIGMSLKKKGHQVWGWDPSDDNLQTSRRRYAIDEITSFEDTCQAEVVFICVPPGHLVSVAEKVYQAKHPETVVTDCGSVKSELCRWADDKHDFVPGHPMAGHEKGGPSFASDWLFRNAKWILTPGENVAPDAIKKVEQLVADMQAVPVRLRPELHDYHVGVLSHLPHILAALLVQMGSELHHSEVSGGSWRDLTRVGGVDPNLWTQILTENREELVKVLADFGNRLDAVREMIHSKDTTTVHDWLTKVVEVKNGA